MFHNPLKTKENRVQVDALHKNVKAGKIASKNQQRKHDLAKKIKKNPERGHEERLHKAMSDHGDRSANDYR